MVVVRGTWSDWHWTAASGVENLPTFQDIESKGKTSKTREQFFVSAYLWHLNVIYHPWLWLASAQLWMNSNKGTAHFTLWNVLKRQAYFPFLHNKDTHEMVEFKKFRIPNGRSSLFTGFQGLSLMTFISYKRTLLAEDHRWAAQNSSNYGGSKKLALLLMMQLWQGWVIVINNPLNSKQFGPVGFALAKL